MSEKFGLDGKIMKEGRMRGIQVTMANWGIEKEKSVSENWCAYGAIAFGNVKQMYGHICKNLKRIKCKYSVDDCLLEGLHSNQDIIMDKIVL